MKNLYKFLTMALLATVLVLATAKPTYACSGLAWFIGVCVDEINQDVQTGMTERAQIAADKEQAIAREQAAAAAAIEQAKQQVEAFRTMDATDQRRHEAELLRMQQQFDAYVTLINAQTQERVTTILQDYQTAQLALREQSDIAISGITGATSITRLRVVWGGITTVLLIVVGAVLALVLLPKLLRPRAASAALPPGRNDQEVRR